MFIFFSKILIESVLVLYSGYSSFLQETVVDDGNHPIVSMRNFNKYQWTLLNECAFPTTTLLYVACVESLPDMIPLFRKILQVLYGVERFLLNLCAADVGCDLLRLLEFSLDTLGLSCLIRDRFTCNLWICLIKLRQKEIDTRNFLLVRRRYLL